MHAADSSRPIRCSSRRQGFTLPELAVAATVIVVAGIAVVQALALLNSKAAAMRILNNARAVVQRNMDTAMGVPYTTSSVPTILATTTTSGSTWVDDGANGIENIVYLRDGVTPLVKGTLTRTVVSEPNTMNQALLRITFQLTYTYRKHNYSYSMTSLRAPD
jgi:prepilin-type N-terminal cleavage/methylation domain-containing protein